MTGDPIPVVEGQTEAFPRDPEVLYRWADRRARARRVHDAPPGSLELGASSPARARNILGWPAAPGDCGYNAANAWAGDPAAQLRTAYVRNPAWTAIGIVCPKCGAFWLKP
jgi:hypothetical protein